VTIITVVLLIACVRKEGQEKYSNEKYGQVSGIIAALPTGKFTALNFIICQTVSVLRKQVSKVVVLCIVVTAARRHFKGVCRFHI